MTSSSDPSPSFARWSCRRETGWCHLRVADPWRRSGLAHHELTVR